MGQSSAILLSQPGCFRGSPWLFCGGLVKCHQENQTPPEPCSASRLQISASLLWSTTEGNMDVCIGKPGNQSQQLARAGIYYGSDGTEYLGMIYYSDASGGDDLPMRFKYVCWAILVLECANEQPLVLKKITKWHEKNSFAIKMNRYESLSNDLLTGTALSELRETKYLVIHIWPFLNPTSFSVQISSLWLNCLISSWCFSM